MADQIAHPLMRIVFGCKSSKIFAWAERETVFGLRPCSGANRVPANLNSLSVRWIQGGRELFNSMSLAVGARRFTAHFQRGFSCLFSLHGERDIKRRKGEGRRWSLDTILSTRFYLLRSDCFCPSPFLQLDTFLWKAPSALIANSQRFVSELKVSGTLDNRRL